MMALAIMVTTKMMMMMAIMLRTMVITAMAGRQRGSLTTINVILEEGAVH